MSVLGYMHVNVGGIISLHKIQFCINQEPSDTALQGVMPNEM